MSTICYHFFRYLREVWTQDALEAANGCVRIIGKNRDFPYGKITIFPGNANTPIIETTEKNLSNEIEGTSKFVCYKQISLQPV